MENNDLKKSNDINATPDEKYSLEDKPSHDPIQHTSVGGELTMPKDANGEILPFRNIERERKASEAQKLKKKDAEGTQVLPNRSWVTNFYHNYIKAVESADLNPKRVTKLGHNPEETNANKIKQVSSLSDLPVSDFFKPQVASSTFQSLLFFKAKKQKSEATYGLKVDTEAIGTYKSSIAQGKDQAIYSSLGDENLAITYKTPTNKEIKPKFSLSDIPIRQFEKFGITQEGLLKTGMLENLLKGEKPYR